MNPSRRTFLSALSALALAPALASCGSEEGAGGSGTETFGDAGTAGGAEDGAFPVTISHKYGETTIDSPPQRIVCVGLTDQDALLALGVVPVGVTYWFGDEELGGIYPWAQDALGDAEPPALLRDTDGIQVEKIAELAPDLVIGQYSGMTQQEYDTLSRLTNVVAQSGDHPDYTTPWQEATTVIGTAVGRPQQVADLVAEVEAQVAQAAADHPEFDGAVAAVVTPYEGLGIYGPEDPRSRMLLDLGFELPTLVTENDDSFYVSLSAERTSDLADLDAVVWLDLDDDPQVRELFERTAAGEEGRYFDISDEDGSYYVAHSFVTPLSIPYVLERYVPQLAAAVDGDPGSEVPDSSA